MKPRLTLVTHVDWGHIRQRPHQLAVALSAHYEVTVVSPVTRKRAQLVDNAAPGIALARVWRLPGSYRSTGVAEANATLASMQCAPQIRRAAVVVLTSPELWPWIAASVDQRTLVYDCMDDALAFEQDAEVRSLKARWEKELLKRSDVVVCSSDELRTRVIERGAAHASTLTVPNGWDPQAFPVAAASTVPREGPIELVYFGTIAEWLDIDALRAVAAQCADVTIRLIGPTAGRYDLSGVAVEPPVEHHRLAAATSSAHALLLPFRVGELTRAVDPVKLYEYVALGKPILSAYWQALDRFAGFVTFYRDPDHLVTLVRTRDIQTPPDADRRAAFLAPQSWQARGVDFWKAIVRFAR